MNAKPVRLVVDGKECLTNRIRLRLGEGWRVDLHELVLESEKFHSHFEFGKERNLRFYRTVCVCVCVCEREREREREG